MKDALIEEIILVTLAHIFFLWHFRSILIVTIPLPLAVGTSFLLMRYAGISSNIMSLGGIAIAIGVLVDAGIVMTENVLRHAEQHFEKHGEYRSQIGEITCGPRQLVGRPIFFSMAIIILAFVPVFALTGMEGKLFHPLAFTKTFAMVGSTIIAVTLVPVLCTFLIRGRLHPEDHNPIMRLLRAIYRPVLGFALRHRAITLLTAAGFFGFAVYLATTIGSEFMPPLDEETAMWMPITDPSISLTKATELMVRTGPHYCCRSCSKNGRRQDRPRGNVNRSGADQHERDDRDAHPKGNLAAKARRRIPFCNGWTTSFELRASRTSGRSPFGTESTCCRPESAHRSA